MQSNKIILQAMGLGARIRIRTRHHDVPRSQIRTVPQMIPLTKQIGQFKIVTTPDLGMVTIQIPGPLVPEIIKRLECDITKTGFAGIQALHEQAIQWAKDNHEHTRT